MNRLEKIYEGVIGYFDLYSKRRKEAKETKGCGSSESILKINAWLFAQYFSLCLGIFAKIYIDNHRKETSILTIPNIIISFIIATIVFPGVHQKFSTESNLTFVQLCITFGIGFAYESLIDFKIKLGA